MKCPLIVDSSGRAYKCEEADCAWWDEEYKQCCVKSLMYSKKALLLSKITARPIGKIKNLNTTIPGIFDYRNKERNR